MHSNVHLWAHKYTVRVVFSFTLLISSVLGLAWTPFFYAIPLVDLLRTATVITLLSSVHHNADKLGQVRSNT